MFVGARYYDAQTGSFISRDTYLDQLPYRYCNGDPVNAVDPSGHLTKGQWWGFGIGVVLIVAVTIFTGGLDVPVLGSALLGSTLLNCGLGAGAGAVGGVVQSTIDSDRNMAADVRDGAILGGLGGGLTGSQATGPLGKILVNVAKKIWMD